MIDRKIAGKTVRKNQSAGSLLPTVVSSIWGDTYFPPAPDRFSSAPAGAFPPGARKPGLGPRAGGRGARGSARPGSRYRGGKGRGRSHAMARPMGRGARYLNKRRY